MIDFLRVFLGSFLKMYLTQIMRVLGLSKSAPEPLCFEVTLRNGTDAQNWKFKFQPSSKLWVEIVKES